MSISQHLSFALIILFYGNSSSSFCSLQGITSSSETLIFAADGAGEDGDDGVSSGDYGIDGCAPWYLRVQELAHDSLIAATRAQLARDAKANQDARAASVNNGKVTLINTCRDIHKRSSQAKRVLPGIILLLVTVMGGLCI